MQLNYLSNSGKKNISTKIFINITILLTYFNVECLLLWSRIACSFVQSKHTSFFQNKQAGSALSFFLLCYLSCYTYFCKSFKTALFFISTLYGLSYSFSYLYQSTDMRAHKQQAQASFLLLYFYNYSFACFLQLRQDLMRRVK